ncbi:MAG: Lead, cadmium, zinc and mercury transporting ATPase [Myxococcaceae bacterium]|nr:Lead, cadmium, zinc and mercury transporting ATPase [Myxococcaceae bacterium]
MPSSKAAERDVLLEPQTSSSGAERESAMPYRPSVPCAACARGVDPLRAACISMTEASVHYFCTRSCRESYVQSEVAHQQKVMRGPDVRWVPEAASMPRSSSFEPVARRVTPAAASTAVWPLVASAALVSLAALPLPGVDRLAALGLTSVAALFASRTALTRQRGSLGGWLVAPLGVALFSLASVLSHGLRNRLGLSHALLWLSSGAFGVLLMWLREHWLEREQAVLSALRTELAARLSPRTRVSSAPAAAEPGRPAAAPVLQELALERVRPGADIVLDAGSVVPVDGVVISGFCEVLPYPRARVPVERQRGQVVLAGALLTRGSLRLRVTQVGDERALFRVFGAQPHPVDAPSAALSIARRAENLESGLQLAVLATLLSFVGQAPVSVKLAGLAAALLSLPAIALARGIRGAYRRATVAASARGVHYRDATSLERAGALDTAVLRVEGPLVARAYTLIEICSLSPSHDATALLELALAAEQAHESHGIAGAVRDYAASLGVQAAPLRRLLHTRGRGVSGLTDGQGALVFGSRAALLGAGVSVAVADREAQRAEQLGQRVVFLALGGRARGLFVFAQTVQPEARVALQTLFDLGLEVELVSGDHRTTVEAIARTLDITQVKAELSSEQRAAEVRRLRDGEAKVIAIGHIPEDQPLLAAADLSLSLHAALPAREHDVVYDITTSSPDLRDAAAALSLARGLRREVRQTLVGCGMAAAIALLTASGRLHPLLCLGAAALVDWLCIAAPRLRPTRGATAEETERARGR